MNGRVINADCIEAIREMDDESVEAVVTDPPYNFEGGFMGQDWDNIGSNKEYQEFCQEWGEQALRVLKPGGHLLAFSGTRTYHRMVVGLEDAGFEIRDMIEYFYGSGFPKSHDISKAIDDHFGEEREKLGVSPNSREREDHDYDSLGDIGSNHKITRPASDAAKKWNGWGTALKPSHEPVVLAQKPREGTYAENVLEYGVGGLNIDACRIGVSDDDPQHRDASRSSNADSMFGVGDDAQSDLTEGRWPTNAVFDRVAGRMLDEQSGYSESSDSIRHNSEGKMGYHGSKKDFVTSGFDDSGGASRFFYSAKAHKSERNAGLEGVEEKKRSDKDKMMGDSDSFKTGSGNERTTKMKNDISTLKPINLMRWLIRLVTPEHGIVLDPFAGSGTTGCAAEIERRDYILIEMRDRFADVIAPRRCEYWSNPENWSELKEHEELPRAEQQRNQSLEEFKG